MRLGRDDTFCRLLKMSAKIPLKFELHIYCLEEGVRISIGSVAYFTKEMFSIHVCYKDLAVLDLY